MTNQPSPRFRAVAGFDDPPRQLKDDRLDLTSALSVLWTHRRLILIATLVSALIGYGLTWMVDKTYEARSTVFVTPPTFSTELTPRPFSIEAYERLAQSDYVRTLVVRELRARKVLAEGEMIGKLDTLLYPSREPLKPFLPLIDLIAHSRTPEMAQLIANVWAEIFVMEQAKLAIIGKSSSVDFILKEFPKASARVLDDERRLKAEETVLTRELTWARTVASVDSKKTFLKSREETIVRAEAELFGLQLDVRQGREKLKRLEAELAQTTPVLTLTKGPSDEAMWNATVQGLGAGTGPANPALSKLSIRTEEVNPVFVSLAQQLSDNRVTVASLETRERTLIQQLQLARKEAATLRADTFASENKISDLEREQSMKLAPRLQAVAEAKALFGKLEQKIGDAQIAKAESGSDVKIGARAELPDAAVAPSVPKYVGSAALLGLVGAVAALWALSYAGVLQRSARELPPPATPIVT